MNKKTIIAVSLMSIVLILIGIVLYQGVAGNLYNKDVFNNCKTFSSFDDFAFLSKHSNDTTYDKEQANDVMPLNQVRYEVTYEKVNYTVYAYEFTSKDDCYKYVKILTGTDYNSVEEQSKRTEFTYYKSASFIGFFQHVDSYVITETKVMRVQGNANNKTYNKFMQFLFANLPTAVEQCNCAPSLAFRVC